MVPLPCAEAREQMLRKNLAGRAAEDLMYSEVEQFEVTLCDVWLCDVTSCDDV